MAFAQKSIFLTLLVLFIVNQASAKVSKCYACYSELDADCINKPKQEKFEQECRWFSSTLFSNMGISDEFSAASEAFYDMDLASVEFQCSTIVATNITSVKQSIGRGCLPKHINNDSVKILNLKAGWLQIDQIARCKKDLCNTVKISV